LWGTPYLKAKAEASLPNRSIHDRKREFLLVSHAHAIQFCHVSSTPHTTILIRPIQESDIPEFHQVLGDVCRERRYLATLEAPSMERTERFVKTNVQKDHPQFVALVDGQLAGWCDAIPGDVSSGNAHVGRLGMGVAKPFRRQGLGAKLMHAVLDKARAQGLRKIELGVYSSNTGALALYERFGFTEEGRKLRSRLVDGHYDDIVMMALFLDA
jgi:RimJ/RimL family protein N-acetyltransferase